MKISEIREKADITIAEIHEEIEDRKRAIFYEQMANHCDFDYISKKRREISELDELLREKINGK